MKRSMRWLLIILILLLVSPTKAKAYTTEKGVITSATNEEFDIALRVEGNGSCKAGDEVKVIFKYTGTITLYSLDFYFRFDTDYLECSEGKTDCEILGRTCDMGRIAFEDEGYGYINIYVNTYKRSNYIKQGEDFLAITFHCKKDIETDQTVVVQDPGFFVDTQDSPYSSSDYFYPEEHSESAGKFVYTAVINSETVAQSTSKDDTNDNTQDNADDSTQDNSNDTSTSKKYAHLYQDYTYTTRVTDDTITNYVGGKTVTTNGTKKNYKSTIVYTDILGSYKYTINAKGNLVTSTGKVIVGVTSSAAKPTLVKGKIVDKEAAKIAKATIKNDQITVTAGKQAGKVYLWVMDTGDVGTFAYCPITVKMTPTTIGTYAISPQSVAFSYDTTKKYTRGDINVSDSTKIYVYPSYKSNNVVTKVTDATLSATVDSKVSDYFSVTQDSDDPYCFIVTAKGLKDGKKVSGKITIQCKENGKKAIFLATACNSVTGITVGNLSNLTTETDSTHLSIGTSATGKTVGTLTLAPSCAMAGTPTTDNVKIYAMGSENGFDAQKMSAGSVKITKTAAKAQKKVSVNVGSDKKTLTVTAAKGATAGVTSYFLIVYNTVKDGDKCGYQVISVTTK